MLGMEWIKHFHEVTKEIVTTGEWRLLIVDGHGSHVTVEFVEFCLRVNIVTYSLPAHSTHLLQPLDIGLFSPLQKAYAGGSSRPVWEYSSYQRQLCSYADHCTHCNIYQKKYAKCMEGSRSHFIQCKTCLEQVDIWSSPAKSPCACCTIWTTYTPQYSQASSTSKVAYSSTNRLKSKDADLDRADLTDLIHQLEKLVLQQIRTGS